MELFDDTNPVTAKNFRALCTGEKGTIKSSGRPRLGTGEKEMFKNSGKPLQYKGSIFHSVIPGISCHGGDITDGDGTGLGELIYEYINGRYTRLKAENFVRKYTGPGTLSMLGGAYGYIGSQFFITTAKTEWLDGKHVAFGQVVEGMEVVKAIDKVGSAKGWTTKQVTIVGCGQIFHGNNVKTPTTGDSFLEPY